MTLREKEMTHCESRKRTSFAVPASKLAVLLERLHNATVDVDFLLNSCEISPSVIQNPEARISLSSWMKLNHLAAEALQEEDLGLQCGENYHGMPTLLGFLLSACADISEALEKFARYQALEHDGGHFNLHPAEDRAFVEYCPPPESLGDRITIDFGLACFIQQYRLLTGRALAIREAVFTYPRPQKIAEHQRIFRCPMRFSGASNHLYIDAAQLKAPLLKSNPALCRYLEQPLQKALTALEAKEPFEKKVLEALGDAIGRGNARPSLQNISGQLGLSARRLQMRLQEQGITFRSLLEKSRQALAREYLADTSFTVQEIAYMLGFSEPSAFHRAFRRWTQQTPSQYRKA